MSDPTDLSPGGAGGPDAPGGSGGDDHGSIALDRERLARELRDTRMQLAMAQTRLAAVEGSASWRFGRVIANAAKQPWPRGALLPRELYKLWRDRGVGTTQAQAAAKVLGSSQLTDLAGSGDRYLATLTAPGTPLLSDPALALAGGAFADAGRGPVITGAISALGCATLAPDAIVHPLLPHDADIVVENTGADVVIIEAAALLPGEPWAFATDPAAADRGRRLSRMIVMARALGKPVVLIRNVPQSRMPGLSWLATTVDAVLDIDLGVQLARFNPVGLPADRGPEPVYAGNRDPREAPGLRVLLDALTVPGPVSGSADGGGEPAVTLSGGRSWRSLPELYRSHALFVTAPGLQQREQRASGARVVSLSGGVPDADAVRTEIDAARAAGPVPAQEIRAALREIFTRDATPVRLAALADAAGLPAGIVAGRQVAVLARVADAAAAARLAGTLQRQRLRPAEVIVASSGPAETAVRDALGGLADAGVRVLVLPAAGPASGDAASGDNGDTASGNAAGSGDTASADTAAWARPLARYADSGWVAPWPGADGPAGSTEAPDTYLLDLVCARECAQADAIGLGPAAPADGPAEFIRFAAALTNPALARRDLLVPDAPPAGRWGGRGLRLFTVTR
jgi:hypothetical protein